MMKSQIQSKETEKLFNFKLGENFVDYKDIIDVLREKKMVRMIVKDLMVSLALEGIEIDPKIEDEIISKFRKDNKLEKDEEYGKFLENQLLSDSLFRKILIKPQRVVKFREEKWGPRANSLYLKYKDKFDLIIYKRLEANDIDAMKEMYYRIKENEETWDGIAKQLFPNATNPTCTIGPVELASVEETLVLAMKELGKGRLSEPFKVLNKEGGDRGIMVELVDIIPCKFNNEVRERILRQEFEKWIEEETTKLMSKVEFSNG